VLVINSNCNNYNFRKTLLLVFIIAIFKILDEIIGNITTSLLLVSAIYNNKLAFGVLLPFVPHPQQIVNAFLVANGGTRRGLLIGMWLDWLNSYGEVNY